MHNCLTTTREVRSISCNRTVPEMGLNVDAAIPSQSYFREAAATSAWPRPSAPPSSAGAASAARPTTDPSLD